MVGGTKLPLMSRLCGAIPSLALFGSITFKLPKLPYFKALFLAVLMDIR